MPESARDWKDADLAAAQEACPSHLDFCRSPASRRTLPGLSGDGQRPRSITIRRAARDRPGARSARSCLALPWRLADSSHKHRHACNLQPAWRRRGEFNISSPIDASFRHSAVDVTTGRDNSSGQPPPISLPSRRSRWPGSPRHRRGRRCGGTRFVGVVSTIAVPRRS